MFTRRPSDRGYGLAAQRSPGAWLWSYRSDPRAIVTEWIHLMTKLAMRDPKRQVRLVNVGPPRIAPVVSRCARWRRGVGEGRALMKFGYTIVYVPSVGASLAFFEEAFGFTRRFLHESGTYGELATGETTLAFAAHELGDMNFSGGHVAAHSSERPLGVELGFVTNDVAAAHARAITAGAKELSSPVAKPWGQTVSWVRCPRTGRLLNSAHRLVGSVVARSREDAVDALGGTPTSSAGLKTGRSVPAWSDRPSGGPKSASATRGTPQNARTSEPQPEPRISTKLSWRSSMSGRVLVAPLVLALLATTAVTTRAQAPVPPVTTAATPENAAAFLGDWSITVTGEQGPFTFDLSLKVEAGKSWGR